MRRNKTGRLFLSSFLLIGVILSSCGNTGSAVIKTDYTPDEKAIVARNITASYTDAAEQAILKQMELVLENEKAALYIGTYYDVAVFDKEAGKVFFSNRQIYEADHTKLTQDQQNNAFSQVAVEYLNAAGRITKLTSFPQCYDAKDKDQVTVEKKDGGVDVTYYFGTKSGDKIICPVMSSETFEKYQTLGEEKRADGSLSRSDWGRFNSAYNHIVLDELSAQERDEYLTQYPKLSELGELYILNPTATYIQLNVVEKVGKLLGMTKEEVEREAELVGGGAELQSETPNFEITLHYALQGPDLIVTVDPAKIVEPQKSYLYRLYILPSFGAVANGENNYLFVPDGSGAVIETGAASSGADNMELPFYGTDYAGNILNQEDVTPEAAFPVFGLKAKNTSVFAVVESNDGMSGVTAQVSNPNYLENNVMPWFIYRNYHKIETGDSAAGLSNVVFSKKTPSSVYAVRYHFLYGEEATYTGMSRYFRTYLEQTDVLTKRADRCSLPVDIDILGAIRKKQFRFGIPMETTVALSPFTEVTNFSNQLAKNGISQISFHYLGMFNGGMEYRSPAKLKTENVLGGQSGFLEMQKKLSEQKNTVAPLVEFNQVYQNGNGIQSGRDLARRLDKNYAAVAPFHPSSGLPDEDNQAFLIGPLSFSSIVDQLITSYQPYQNSRLFLENSASLLHSNYNESREVTREEARLLTEEALNKLKESGLMLELGGANLYALQYADRLSGIPVKSSERRLISYSVPFVGMVLHGRIDYTGPALNQEGNIEKALLQTLESGAGLRYRLMTGDTGLLAKTKYTGYDSISAADWQKHLVSTYQELEQFYKETADAAIQSHLRLTDGVVQMIYDNGSKIVLNYNDTEYSLADGTKVAAMGYHIFK